MSDYVRMFSWYCEFSVALMVVPLYKLFLCSRFAPGPVVMGVVNECYYIMISLSCAARREGIE